MTRIFLSWSARSLWALLRPPSRYAPSPTHLPRLLRVLATTSTVWLADDEDGGQDGVEGTATSAGDGAFGMRLTGEEDSRGGRTLRAYASVGRTVGPFMGVEWEDNGEGENERTTGRGRACSSGGSGAAAYGVARDEAEGTSPWLRDESAPRTAYTGRVAGGEWRLVVGVRIVPTRRSRLNPVFLPLLPLAAPKVTAAMEGGIDAGEAGLDDVEGYEDADCGAGGLERVAAGESLIHCYLTDDDGGGDAYGEGEAQRRCTSSLLRIGRSGASGSNTGMRLRDSEGAAVDESKANAQRGGRAFGIRCAARRSDVDQGDRQTREREKEREGCAAAAAEASVLRLRETFSTTSLCVAMVSSMKIFAFAPLDVGCVLTEVSGSSLKVAGKDGGSADQAEMVSSGFLSAVYWRTSAGDSPEGLGVSERYMLRRRDDASPMPSRRDRVRCC
ncbi:hypothetical protein R3P38DRAFT_2758666 [Favolaschia claudopus]|uniref:Uncharacterized protein n=1 Tax=Favolaschia claudopus TaxID=2862362 RepID=A0AAW0EBJ1_9AGAR